ncbi:hypothetical protein GCM10020331_031610 [Ectobacillus funiculus]
MQQAQLSVQRVYEQLEHKPLNMKAVNGALEEALSLVNSAYADTAALIEKGLLGRKGDSIWEPISKPGYAYC